MQPQDDFKRFSLRIRIKKLLQAHVCGGGGWSTNGGVLLG